MHAHKHTKTNLDCTRETSTAYSIALPVLPMQPAENDNNMKQAILYKGLRQRREKTQSYLGMFIYVHVE